MSNQTQRGLEIRLFGALTVLVDGQPMARVRTRSVEWLLALLVLRNGRPASRSWLAGTLWPESEESRALENLRHDLVSLRKALGSQGDRLQSPTRDSLFFDLNDVEVDVHRFDAAVQQGDHAAAVNLYRGALLEGCPKEWAVSEREARAEQCLSALLALAAAAAERGNHAQALSFARKAEALDALRDSTARRLMASLAAIGDPGAAVEVYRNLRQRLHDELHLAPDEATTRLFQEIRANPVRPSAPPPRSAGRLKAAPFPLSPLIGREEEVEAVQRCLDEYRLVVLTGVGGVGKTRIAIEVASRIRDERPVAWVELALLENPKQLVPTIAAALGIGADDDTEDTAIQRIFARIEETRLLIALDNCEHLLESVAALAETLLGVSGSLQILATSRQRLGLPGEMAWRVPSLAIPDAAALPLEIESAVRQAIQFPAVQLFLERAKAVRPGLQISGQEELTAVCTICRRLDGIPLALELAAARLATLTPVDIAKRLDDRFALLTTGARTSLPRQKTLKALIAWSYELLTEDERAAMRDMSVFVGGWTLEAAEAVCGRNGSQADVLDITASLADKSLIVAEQEGWAIRYRMLESVRAYALEELEGAGEQGATRDRHMDYFLRLGEGVSALLRDAGTASVLDAEISNMNAALVWARENHVGAYSRLVAVLWPYWLHRGSVFDGCLHLEAALDMGAGPVESLNEGAHALADALHNSHYFLAARSAPDPYDPEEQSSAVIPVLERSLAIQKRLGHKADMVITLRCIRGLVERYGDHERSVKLAREAVAISRELGSRLYLALMLHEGGCALYRVKDLRQARELLAEALMLFRKPGGRYGVGFAANNLALTLRELGEIDGARALHREGLIEALHDGIWNDVIWSLAGFAETGAAGKEASAGALVLGSASTLDPPLTNLGLLERASVMLRKALGEEGFEEAFATGRSLGAAGGRASALDYLNTFT